MMAVTADRECKEWWIVLDDQIRHEKGYSCAPDNPDVWWFPSVGNSLTQGYQVFHDRASAKAKLIRDLERIISEAKGKLANLRSST